MDLRLLGPLTVLDRPGQPIEINGEPPTALLAVRPIARQHVGTLPAAKGSGSLPLYALHQEAWS